MANTQDRFEKVFENVSHSCQIDDESFSLVEEFVCSLYTKDGLIKRYMSVVLPCITNGVPFETSTNKKCYISSYQTGYAAKQHLDELFESVDCAWGWKKN